MCVGMWVQAHAVIYLCYAVKSELIYIKTILLANAEKALKIPHSLLN